MLARRRRATQFPYTTLFRSGTTESGSTAGSGVMVNPFRLIVRLASVPQNSRPCGGGAPRDASRCDQEAVQPSYSSKERSEEHTSELQSRQYLVCRLLL